MSYFVAAKCMIKNYKFFPSFGEIFLCYANAENPQQSRKSIASLNNSKIIYFLLFIVLIETNKVNLLSELVSVCLSFTPACDLS